MNLPISIKQRKEDCHYETIISETRHGGWYPVFIGYGFSRESADLDALKKLLNIH